MSCRNHSVRRRTDMARCCSKIFPRAPNICSFVFSFYIEDQRQVLMGSQEQNHDSNPEKQGMVVTAYKPSAQKADGQFQASLGYIVSKEGMVGYKSPIPKGQFGTYFVFESGPILIAFRTTSLCGCWSFLKQGVGQRTQCQPPQFKLRVVSSTLCHSLALQPWGLSFSVSFKGLALGEMKSKALVVFRALGTLCVQHSTFLCVFHFVCSHCQGLPVRI